MTIPDLTGYEFDEGSQPKPVTEVDVQEWAARASNFAQASVLEEVVAERRRQDEQWGGPEHDDKHSVRDWVTFVVAYLGKGVNRNSDWGRKLSVSRYALVQVAALCVAAIEALDRRITREGLGD